MVVTKANSLAEMLDYWKEIQLAGSMEQMLAAKTVDWMGIQLAVKSVQYLVLGKGESTVKWTVKTSAH